jgi:integrase/recombinase XerD
MTLLAPTLQGFFTTRLISERQASPATIAAYRDTFCLLVRFAAEHHKCQPSALDFAQLDAPLIGAFLQHLENDRHNSVRTRNARLAGIHSLFRYAALHHPEHAGTIQRVLAIPNKRFERAVISFLTKEEAAALLEAPDRSTWTGRRDHAMLDLAVQTGLRVGELVQLTCADVVLTTAAHVRCQGKGRKQRITPLTPLGTSTLKAWLSERKGAPADPLFPSRRGSRLSTDAVEFLVAKYAALAQHRCPSLASKHVTPHVLRHSCAMFMREAKIDISNIALWLGHETIATVQIYLHADLAIKERALALAAPPGTPPGRYRPSDPLLAFLEGL